MGSQASTDTSRWAVLVGIDRYGDEGDLKGCANDAVLFYNFLRKHLGVPAGQIFLHICRDSENIKNMNDTQEALCEPHESLEATPAAVKLSLEKVLKAGQTAKKAGNDAFVHVHFSGHGDTQNTIFRNDSGFAEVRKKLSWFPDLSLDDKASQTATSQTLKITAKSSSAKDEILCFPEGEGVTDVEFGLMMTTMAEAGLTVSITVDCCFAGGTMRNSNSTVRCRSTRREYDTQNHGKTQSDHDVAMAWEFRNCILRDSFLYRQQDRYNAILACQADQQAAEGCTRAGHCRKVYGIFTSALVDRLESLAGHLQHFTYRQFQTILGAVIHDVSRQKQVPAYFGPDEQILFHYEKGLPSQEYAYVKEYKAVDDRIVIVRGRLTGARPGDVYCLLDRPSVENETVNNSNLFKIIKVDNFESVCKSNDPSISDALLGNKRIAKLTQRAPIRVLVTNDGSKRAVRETEEILRTPDDGIVAFIAPKVVEEEASKVVGLCMHVSVNNIEIKNGEGRPFERLPKISVDDAEKMEKIVDWLQSMHAFWLFSEMSSPVIRNESEKPFHLEMIPVALPPQVEVEEGLIVASHSVKFTNLSKTTLYFSLLNLNPGYGIDINFPDPETNQTGQHVAAGERFGSDDETSKAFTVLETVVPKSLIEKYEADPAHKLYDTRRLIVTTQPVDLRCFEQPDVTWQDATGSRRTVEFAARQGLLRRQPDVPTAGCWLEDYPIRSPSERPKIKIPPSKFKVGQRVYDNRLPAQLQPYKIADKPRPRDNIYLLCDLHNNSVVNTIDGGNEFKEEHLVKA